MKVVIVFLGILALTLATAVLPRSDKGRRLGWLRRGGKNAMANPVSGMSFAPTPTGSPGSLLPWWYTTYNPWNWTPSSTPTLYTGKPPSTGSTYNPWNWGPSSTATPYYWQRSTTYNPWNWDTPSPSTPYNWQRSTYGTTWYPWGGGTTRWYPGTTPLYPTPGYGYCPYGTISSFDKTQCFKLYYDQQTFIEAEVTCQNNGGHLASLHSAFDNALLNDYARNMYGSESNFYIGANDLQDKRWEWSDGSYFDFQDWYYNQNGGNFLDCAQVVTTHGAWVKVDCYTESPFACSFPSYWKK